jgi:hypothetical protein
VHPNMRTRVVVAESVVPDLPTVGGEPYRRLAIVAFLTSTFVTLTCLHRAMADGAGPIIPLPDTDRAQLDRLLGKDVVGEALPSPPLAGIEAYLPPKDRVMTLRVVTNLRATSQNVRH